MSTSAPRKFGFDTVFDDAGEVAYAAPRQKRLYPVEEVEAMLAQARAEGEQAAMQGMAALQAQALAQIAQACSAALPGLAAVAHEHREGSAELALACARAIADAALERFPEAPVRAALESLAREVSAAPRLVVSVAAPLVEPVQAVLAETAQSIGYAGHIQAKAGAGYVGAQFTLDFGDGSAAFDPAAAAQRVAQALEAALAAEGLHAEPLIPGQG